MTVMEQDKRRMIEMGKYIVKMYGPDAEPSDGEELYDCDSKEEVKREIEFQRIAFPFNTVYCVERKSGKLMKV